MSLSGWRHQCCLPCHSVWYGTHCVYTSCACQALAQTMRKKCSTGLIDACCMCLSGCQQQQALHAREVVICGCTYVLALLHVCTGLQSTVAGSQRFVNGCNTRHPFTYAGHCVWSPISHRQSLPFLLSCSPAECLAHGQSHNRKRMHRIGVFCHTKCAIVRILSQASRAGQHVRRYGTHHGHRGGKRPPPPHLAPKNFELNLHHASSSNPSYRCASVGIEASKVMPC